MRQSLKIALSLLISVVLFSGFAVLAFTNLFSLIETGFFQPRVRAEVLSRLASAASAVGAYHDRNLERFRVAADSQGASSALRPSPPPEDMRALDEAVGDLQGQVAALTNVRIVEAKKNLIHYSRLPSDLREATTERTAYKRLAEADDTVPLERLEAAADAGSGVLLIDGPHDRFIYSLPVGSGGATALFYVDSLDLAAALLRTATPGVTEVSTFSEGVVLVNAGATAGVLINASGAERKNLSEGLLEAMKNRPPAAASFDAPLTVDVADGQGATNGTRELTVFATPAPRTDGGDWGLVARTELRSAFEMSLFFRVLLLASFFITVFLVTYLLFNLRPDPLDVVSQRVKRFQIQLLESLLEREGTADWGRWRGELESRRDEITRQVQRGIGRVSKRQQPEINAYIDKGWNEILDLLERRAGSAPAPAALDVSRLEGLIQQALKSASFVVPAQIIGAQAAKPAAGPAVVERGRPIQVEELRAEEVEDLPEAESVEEIPEASLEEPVVEAEAVTEAEEAAEAGKAVAAAEVAEVEEIAEAEEAVEVEEVAEAEEVAEVEEVAEAEEAADVEEIEELEAAGPAEDAAAVHEEVPGTLPELSIPVAETLEELAPAEGAGGTDEAGREAAAYDAGGPSRPAPAGAPAAAPAPGAAGRPSADSFLDALEELEAVTEITPLPPLPEEEGLEMLLPADDGGPEGRTGTAKGRGIVGSGPAGPADVESPEDFEELEMLEEATEPGEESLSDDDQRQEIERLIASGGIRTWTIEQLQKAANEARSAIVVEDGVFRIKNEVYSAGARGSGRLKRIADEVIGHEPPDRASGETRGGRGEPAAAPAGEAASESGFSGIVDLMRDAEPLDLFKVVGADRESAAEPAPVEAEGSKVLQLKRNGLDYDEFLAAFPRSFSHTTQMKSLVEVSRRVAAVSAGLLLKKADGWSPDLTIGLGDRTLAGLNFRKEEPFGTLLLGKRLAVAIDRPPGELKTIRVRIDPEDLRYAKRLLLLPATFRGQEAYLLFIFAADSDILLESVLSSLQVQ